MTDIWRLHQRRLHPLNAASKHTHTKQKTNCITWTTKWSVAKSKTCPKSKLICPKSQIVAVNPLSTVCSYPFLREIWTPHLIRRFIGSHECVIETGLHKVRLFSPKNHQCALHNFFMGQKPIKTQKYFLDLSTGWLLNPGSGTSLNLMV